MSQVRQEMRPGQFCLQLLQLFRRDQAPEEFAKIETNADSVDPDEAGHVFDVVDITIESRFFLLWTNEDSVDSDDAAARANHPDLLVADIAIDVVITPGVGVGNDQRPFR